MPTDVTALPLLPTAVVGSHPQPGWLIDRDRLAGHVPRARAEDLWRVAPGPLRTEAQDDAAVLAVRDMERAGIDVVTDGEVRRESYSNHLLGGLEGVDLDNPATIRARGGFTIPVPRIVGPIQRTDDVELEALRHLLATTDRVAKVTLPGPFTLGQQAVDEHYGDPEALAMAFADAVNAEARALESAGAQIVQLDEPWLRNDPGGAERYAVRALDRALAGLSARTVVHLCFGYAAVVPADKPNAYAFLAPLADSTVDEISIEAAQPRLDLGVLADLAPKRVSLGVIDLRDGADNSVSTVAHRLRAGLRHLSADLLVASPDCGMKYLTRADARSKLTALTEAAAQVRAELT
ncbi:MAG: 5-methyltetrahydropteroyltriglutamate--homocysteine methyltransferase [Acidimicrobiia bacterium]|nr:5-methyltetrahydropteroyltriglutamate--homocysteine methyltransferase [Acidimicrobiia bacterium]MDH5289025.1 5-methyltetrahydropteroyltriglutamate--homocysteine methyltransferase [Acidimicrobiia bacterium]